MFNARTLVLSSLFVFFMVTSLQTFATIGIEADVLPTGIENTNSVTSQNSLYTIVSSYDHPSLLGFENGLFPVWTEFIHYLDNEVKQKNSIQVFIDPDFAFGFEMLSQCMKERAFDEVQISASSAILEPSVQVNFKLTQQALKKLEKDGVPDELLKNLERFKDQEFTQECEFLAGIETQIGGEQTDRYKDLILQHASMDRSVSTVGFVNVSEGVNFVDISFDSTKNIESWDAGLYYSRKFKQRIFDNKNKRRPKVSTTIPPDEEDIMFDILEFFKKWGFPKPLTVVLLVIVAYSILAFLVRK